METETPLGETPDDNTPITKQKRKTRMVLTDEQRKERAENLKSIQGEKRKARQLEIAIREEKAMARLEKLREERIARYGKADEAVPPPPPPKPEPEPEPKPKPKPKPDSKPKKKRVKKIVIQESSEDETDTETDEEVVIISSKRKESGSITKSKASTRPQVPKEESPYVFKFI